MRKLLLNPTPLFRKLRQLSMLLTLLLALPLSAWGKGYRTTGNVTDTGTYPNTNYTWYTSDENNWSWSVMSSKAGLVTSGGTEKLAFTLDPGDYITLYFSLTPASDWYSLRKIVLDGLSSDIKATALFHAGNTDNLGFVRNGYVFTPDGWTSGWESSNNVEIKIENDNQPGSGSLSGTINSITLLTGSTISSDGLAWPTDSPINELTKSVSNNVTTLSGNCAANTSFSFPLKKDGGDNTLSNLDSNYNIEYSSSNTNVATVSGSYVTIKGYGSTTITATLTENDYYSYEQSEYSYTLTNTESYGLTIAGTPVTSENAANILGDGKVAFTPASEANDNKNILSLNNAVITTGGIESSIGDLTINLKGTNNIGDNSTSIATGISSTNNGTLTFTVDGSGGSLSINTTTSAVSGFADVTLGTGTYLNVGTPTKYDTNGKNFREQIGSANIVKVMQITSQAYYPLWVNGAQVAYNTSDTQFTFYAGTNTLALASAWISAGIVSGLDNLIITLNGNNTIELSDTTAAIRSINPAATLTIQKSASAENGSLNMKNNANNSSSSPVIKNFQDVSHTGLNFVSKTGTTLDAATVHDATLSSATIYPLWIGGTLVTAATHSFNGTSGTIDYASGTNTLTLTNYDSAFGTDNTNINAIETGIVGLKVILDGDQNNLVCNGGSAYVFKATHSNASIQFVRKDATSKLTMSATNVFGGFSDGKVTYDGLFYYANGDSKLITQPAAPELSKWTAYDDKNISYTYAFIDYAAGERTGNANDGYTALYASANPVKKYSFDYVDPNIEDVTNQNYPATGGIKLTAPGILTAWIEVGTAKSAESKGVRFGILENPVEMEFDGVARTIDFTPAPTMTNAVTPSVNSDYTTSFNSFATLDATNNKITINSCYDGMIGFTFTNTDGGYTSLNDTTKITFNVTPPKPTLSVGGGTYDEAQTVSITSNYQGTEATIKYYFGEAEASSETYTTALTISETKTLTAWVEVNGVKSDTVQAPYTIRQAANLSYSAETATALIEESEITFTAPTLTNTNQINITYSSSNENVAIISDAGAVTIKGAGTTTISATPTDATTYIPTPASYVLTVTRNIINPFSDVMEGQNFATYYNHNEDLALPEGLTAYIVTGVSGTTVTITATGYLPKDVPLLLEKTGELTEGTLEMNGYSGETGSFSSNKLKYVNLEAGETASGNEYVLYMNEFVKATGTIPQGKCYLDLTGVSGARGMYGIGGDGSTGIQGIGREATENGQWYDLQGRRIQQPTKAGIYIVNGKKVIINKK